MKFLLAMPEAPIVEDWFWQTDVQVSDDGTETRISLRDEPKRTIAVKYLFDDDMEYRIVKNVAFDSFDRPFLLPFYQQGVRLTANLNVGGINIACNTARTDLRPGCSAVLYDRTGAREAVTVLSVVPGACVVTAPVSAGWRRDRAAMIAPAWPVYVGPNSSFSRRVLNGGSLSISASDIAFMVPFVNPQNAAQLPIFDSLPVFATNAIGSEFDESFANGSSIVDHGGIVNVRSPWKHPQIQMSRTFLLNRSWDFPSWQRFVKLADYCKGSQHPFYMPTFRRDFAVSGAIAPGAVTMDFEGIEYADEFYPFAAFKQFAFFTRAGVHYAKASNCVKIGGKSRVTFAPALPVGALWGQEQQVSLLLKVRIADDKVSCEHTALQTKATLNLRTVDG
jgi:hypothetical protein